MLGINKMISTMMINFDKQMKFAIIILIIFIKLQSQPISNTSISIFLKNGNVLHNDSIVAKVHRNKIDTISLCGHHYYSSETDSIVVDSIKGIPFQNSWIFEKRKGNISVYTNLPKKSDNKITFISKKDSICAYSLLSLYKFVGDDSRSHSLVEGKMVADFFTYVPMAIGLSYGISQIFHRDLISNSGHGLLIPPLFFVFGVAFSLPCYLTRNNVEMAIENYNTINFNLLNE